MREDQEYKLGRQIEEKALVVKQEILKESEQSTEIV